ncbi:MAG: hypothetical protein CVV52_11090 [Spirochaetae bacterium HGW-Spirochaetae-8]|jgi:hypothetical protein|nr:MAG: hypothetical protein CVV52_11090 [Spirochaetae bacterium HGW-Spirochaetae-8]
MVLRALLIMLALIACFSCSRAEFGLQQIYAYPVIIQEYKASSIGPASEGLSLAALPLLRESSEYFISVADPTGELRWEQSLAAFDVDGIAYLGLPDLLLPQGFTLPQGVWEVELLHADGRRATGEFTLQDNALFRSAREAPQLWIPQFTWQPSETIESETWQLYMQTESVDAESRPLQELWDIQFIDENGTVLHALQAKEGRLTSNQIDYGTLRSRTVLIKCSRYDTTIGCMLVGLTYFT